MEKLIRVSAEKSFKSYVGRCKNLLRQSEKIHLEGLGEAIITAIKVGDSLLSQGYVYLEKFETGLSEDTDFPKEKAVLILIKSRNYDRACQEFDLGKNKKAN